MASSQSKFYGALALILIVGAALIGYVAVSSRNQTSFDSEAWTAVPEGPLVSEDVGVSIGSADAPIVIEEYADYLCPYCGMVATLTVPQIIEEYVETGKARFVFFEFPVSQAENALLGAEAARCAGEQGAFWPLNRVLMGRMSEWGQRRDPRGLFRQYADGLGLDGDAVIDCVDSQKYRETVMSSQMRARQLGLTATPTFIINGRRAASAMGFDQMSALIEEELAKQ